MKGIIVNQNVEYGVFKKYYDGYFQFLMDTGDMLVFEELSPSASKGIDLKSNQFHNKSFEITYSEYSENEDENFVSYKIEKLELI
ncbi:hypothetical protein GCM10022393_10740 [Aquimarina addita]|uniref:Uncharacterized protein n=1 Tax=Aquimarina addita TaxID=870485 RepID=A0ABP7XDA7_9FLAO